MYKGFYAPNDLHKNNTKAFVHKAFGKFYVVM